MQVIGVKFEDDGSLQSRSVSNGGQKTYHYFYTGTIDLKPGMYAVVDVTGKYKLVRIDTVVGSDQRHLATKPVVSIVDDSDYKDELEKAKKRAALIKELEKLRERQDQIDRYRMLEGNADAAKLLEELKSIDAGATPRQRILEDSDNT